MRDFLGNELFVGDDVVMIRPQYRDLVKAKILRFSMKTVFLEYKHPSFGPTEVKQTPDQLVKV